MTGTACAVCKIVGVVVAIGAINWGVVGLWQTDLVAKVLGYMTGPARAVYVLIGIAGVLKVLSCFKCCPCQKGTCASPK